MINPTRLLVFVALAVSLVACSDEPMSDNNDSAEDASVTEDTGLDASNDVTDTADDATDTASETGDDSTSSVDTSPLGSDDRPAEVVIPSDYDPNQSYPLVFLLHGYTASAGIQDAYWQVSNKVDSYGFILVLPNGTRDGAGNRFWDASSWCCNFTGSPVDDSGYLEGLIDEAESRFSVDPNRIYFMGHSNGGFMSFRMACDHADRVAAIASLAGSGFVDAETCEASQPVAVLQAHGTLDETIAYDGSAGQYPAAEELMSRWATRNGCDETSSNEGTLDMVTGNNGDETDVLEWQNCDAGTSTLLWKLNGAGHIPTFTGNFTTGLLDFLFAHEK
jgi:polyhydroxybutyrate depolymerase